MLENLEHTQVRRNGHDTRSIVVSRGTGLANTNPHATHGSTWAGNAPAAETLPSRSEASPLDFGDHWRLRTFESFSDRGAQQPLAPAAGAPKQAHISAKPKAAGQIVLFGKVMADWAFNDREAATLLGFEAASDMRDIYDGRRSVGHRDANDRLRTILRIATDLDELFQDVAVIQRWLVEPQSDIDGQTPRQLLLEGSMENVLRIKYYVAHLSGR